MAARGGNPSTLIAALSAPALARAQAAPRPVVPFAAGGPADMPAPMPAQRMGAVADNRAGGSGRNGQMRQRARSSRASLSGRASRPWVAFCARSGGAASGAR